MGESSRFELNEFVDMALSGERGIVIGRAEYTAAENSYLVRYKASDGGQVEAWWNESALTRAFAQQS